MTKVDRDLKIAAYGRAYALLMDAVREFPAAMWHFRPSPGDWTVHEVLVHVADSEANSFVRCRRAIAEPGKSVMAYDEMGWARALRYEEQSVDDALDLFRVLRQNTFKLIKALPESVWSHTIEHPENGTMTLDDWLEVYERHVPEHIEQMQAVHRAWLEHPA